MNDVSCRSILNSYISSLLDAICKSDLTFDVLSGMVDGCIDFDTSDIDIICKSHSELSQIVTLAKTTLIEFGDLSLVLDRNTPSRGVHIIVSCNSTVVMLDLFVDLKFYNMPIIRSDMYFEMKSEGIDPRPIVSFLKHKTGYMQAWPRIPSVFYQLEKVNVSFANKTKHYWLKYMNIFRELFRDRRGVFVVLLSPDGGGKSSVATAIRTEYQGKRKIIPFLEFHWRATLREKAGSAPVVNPHAERNRGSITSNIKIAYLLVIFWLGYLLKVKYPLQRGFIVLFDRYYHDLLVDPKRYRYGGPMWLARLVGRLVPKPDLWILLDAPAEVVQSRKHEVPFEETARQRQAYLDLVKGFKNSVIIDASQPLDDVVAGTNRAILEFMAKRTEKRLARYTR